MLPLTMRQVVSSITGLLLLLELTLVASSCSGTGSPNIKVQFVNSRVGWIVGRNLWRTDDGGANWKVVRGDGFGTFEAEYIGYGHRVIHFVDPDFGVQLGPGVLAKTVDGGRTWSEDYSLPQQADKATPPQTVLFISRELGWLVGEFIYKTTDGAKTWQTLGKMPLDDPEVEQNPKLGSYTDYMPSLWFRDSNHGVLAQVDGKVYATNDGGATWEKVYTAGKPIRDLVFVDEKTGWIVGVEGLMLRTDDSGRSWKVIQTNTDVTLNSISFSGKRTGCAVGYDGIIMCTTDGGTTWRKGNIKGVPDPVPPLGSISLVDDTHAWAVGGNSDPMKPSTTAPSSFVVRSDDGGLNWYVVNL